MCPTQNFIHVTYQQPEALSTARTFEPVGHRQCRLTREWLTLVPHFTQYHKASHTRATNHPHTTRPGWEARWRSTSVQGIPTNKMHFVDERHIHSNDWYSLLIHALVDPGTQVFQQHTTATQFSVQGMMSRHWPTIFAQRDQTKCFSEGLDHDTRATVILYPFIFATLQTFLQPTDQLLCCAHEKYVAQSTVHCRRSTPRSHHSRRRFLVFATVLSLVWPLTQSTIVLQPPLISRVSFSLPSSSGGNSVGFFASLVSFALVLLLHGLSHGRE